MLTAVFYAFSKRENSTLIPSSSVPSYSMNIDINDPNTSVLNPQLRVRMPIDSQTGNPMQLFLYNYVYIQGLGRYYYITDWNYNSDGTWTASCKVDVLASWKTYIMTSGGYVGRSEAFFDGGIQDIAYPAKNEPVTIRNNVATGFSPVASWGTVVLGVVTSQASQSAGIMGGTRYYAMTTAQFLSFVQHLLGFWSDGTQTVLDARQWVLEDMQNNFQNDWFKSLYTPAEYVISCRYYPVKFNIAAGATPTQICLGGWNCGGNGGILMGRMYEELPFNSSTGQYYWGEIPISNVNDIVIDNTHPYSNDDYPSYAPYAEYALQTPWGTFPLDANRMSVVLKRPSPKLYWKMMINFVDGTGTLVVSDTGSYSLVDNTPMTTKFEFFRQEVKIAVDIPLMAQYQNELKVIGQGLNTAGSAITTVGSFATGNAIGAMLGLVNTAFGVADTLANTQRYADGSKQYSGSNTPLITQMTVQQTRYPTVERAPSLFGKPLKRYVAQLNNYNSQAFSGFVQLDYSNFKAPCTETERAAVRDYLEGGVHIE